MAYCTLQNVNDLVPQAPFTDTAPISKPSASAVLQMIDDISANIDARLGSIYLVPITGGPKALQELRQICSWGALGRAQEARWTNLTSTTGQQFVGAGNWTVKYEQALARLLDDNDSYVLSDAAHNADYVPKQASAILDSNALVFTAAADHFEADAPVTTMSQVF